jgi:hypothetical protein
MIEHLIARHSLDPERVFGSLELFQIDFMQICSLNDIYSYAHYHASIFELIVIN